MVIILKIMSEYLEYITNKNPQKRFEFISYDQISDFKPKIRAGKEMGIFLIINGTGEFHHHDKINKIQRGDLVLINPNSLTGVGALKNETLSFHSLGVIDKKLNFTDESEFIIKNIGSDSIIFHLIRRMYTLMKDSGNGVCPLADKYFEITMEEILKICGYFGRNVTASKQSTLAYLVKEYIDMNFMQKISIKSLTNKFSCSSSTLLHEFKKYIGKTILEYTLEKKLEIAKLEIRTTSRTIYDISDDIGFSSPQFFYSYFYKKTGMTPREYRISTTKNYNQ